MISYKIASENDMKDLMQIRMEMLKERYGLPADHKFDYKFIMSTKNYFENEDHITVLSVDEDVVIGCATACFYKMMPTYEHPEDRRGCITNVFVAPRYRRLGVATQMVDILLDMTKSKKVSEINAYTTEEAKGLYDKFGFTGSEDLMILSI